MQIIDIWDWSRKSFFFFYFVIFFFYLTCLSFVLHFCYKTRVSLGFYFVRLLTWNVFQTGCWYVVLLLSFNVHMCRITLVWQRHCQPSLLFDITFHYNTLLNDHLKFCSLSFFFTSFLLLLLLLRLLLEFLILRTKYCKSYYIDKVYPYSGN